LRLAREEASIVCPSSLTRISRLIYSISGSGFYAVELIRQLEGLIQPKKIECVHEVEPTPLSFGELEGHPLEYILYFFGGSHRPVHIPITLRDDLNPGTVVHIMRSTRQIERSDAGFRFNGLPRWVFSALNDGLLDSIAYTDCLISVHYLQIPWRSGAISSITLHETYISEGAGKWSVIYDAICRLCRRLTDLHVRGCGYAREETSRNWVKIPESEIDAAILEKDRIALDRLFQTVAENQGGTA
jgi:hypothetical protein